MVTGMYSFLSSVHSSFSFFRSQLKYHLPERLSLTSLLLLFLFIFIFFPNQSFKGGPPLLSFTCHNLQIFLVHLYFELPLPLECKL